MESTNNSYLCYKEAIYYGKNERALILLEKQINESEECKIQ